MVNSIATAADYAEDIFHDDGKIMILFSQLLTTTDRVFSVEIFVERKNRKK